MQRRDMAEKEPRAGDPDKRTGRPFSPFLNGVRARSAPKPLIRLDSRNVQTVGNGVQTVRFRESRAAQGARGPKEDGEAFMDASIHPFPKTRGFGRYCVSSSTVAIRRAMSAGLL